MNQQAQFKPRQDNKNEDALARKAALVEPKVDLIGLRITALRKTRGFSMADLARAAKVWPRHISRIEHGLQPPRVRTILKLLAAIAGPSAIADMAIVARRIRLARQKLLMTQFEFAGLVGIRRDQLADYEGGSVVPGLNVLRRICEWLGVSLDFFLWRRGLGELMEKEYAAATERLNERVRDLCAKQGLTLSEVERRASLGGSHLSQIILGRKKPQGKTLLRLAKVLGAGPLVSSRVRVESELRRRRRAAARTLDRARTRQEAGSQARRGREQRGA